MTVQELFEAELQRRGLAFRIAPESGRYELEIEGWQMQVHLDNLERDIAADGDTGRVSRFVDAIVASVSDSDRTVSAEDLYWCLERNDYEEPADFRVALSDRVDRVLVHLSPDGDLVTWVTPDTLEQIGLSEADAATQAFDNLARALGEATVESQEIDGVRLGFIGSMLPFKASLILAPNLREVVETGFGWPLMAVAPARDFLYIWGAQHEDFVQRVGSVVVREFAQAAYPVSTEVYEISDEAIRAIGEFPRGA